MKTDRMMEVLSRAMDLLTGNLGDEVFTFNDSSTLLHGDQMLGVDLLDEHLNKLPDAMESLAAAILRAKMTEVLSIAPVSGVDSHWSQTVSGNRFPFMRVVVGKRPVPVAEYNESNMGWETKTVWRFDVHLRAASAKAGI